MRKRIFHLITLVILLCFTVEMSFASAELVVKGDSKLIIELDQVSSDETAVELIENSYQKVAMIYKFSKIQSFNVVSEKGIFTEIIIPKAHYIGNIGTPKLPALKKLIEIPFGAKVSINVKSYSTIEYKLSNCGINNPLLPVQPSLPKNIDPRSVDFVYDIDSYTVDEFRQYEIATVEELGVLRGVRFARVVVAPVRYNPVKGVIKVYNNIEVEINFSGSDIDLTEYIKASTYSPYFEAIYRKIINYKEREHGYPDHPDLTKYPVKYLIVADRMFESQLEPFIEWKSQKGFTVIVTYTDVIGTSYSNIQTWIHNQYNSGTPADPAPSFVLFVGDTPQIPAETGSSSGKATDLYYCSVDGDYFPEMYYGRFSATTADQLQPQVDRTLYYEKYQFSDPSFLDNVTLIAGVDPYWNPNVGQPTVLYGTENYFNVLHGFNDVHVYLDSYSGCYETINDGISLINYTAHGSQTSWGNPGMSQSDVNALTNDGKYPLAIGNCCLSGDFGYSECFGETWLRATNNTTGEPTGAIGYIASAPSSYWFEDFYWAVGAFPIIGDNNGYVPPYDSTSWGAYDAPFVSDYVTQDALNFVGNLAVTEADIQGYPTHVTGSSALYYWQAYNLLGDPSVVVYMTQGENNNVSFDGLLPIGSTSFTVNAEPGSYVGISMNGVLHGAGLIGEYGTANIPITPFTVAGTADIIVTKPQYKPVFTTVLVATPAVVGINPDSISINVSTEVTISVYEEDGTTPISDVDVWIEGWGVDSEILSGTTSGLGELSFSITPPYGERLRVIGKRPVDNYLLFTKYIYVTDGIDLTNANITPSVASIGLFGLLTPYYEGLITSTCDEAETVLFARGCGVDTSVVATEVNVIPDEVGIISAAIAKSGYNVYEEDILVETVYGTLSGIVRDESEQGVPEAAIKGFLQSNPETPAFTAITNSLGQFTIEGELEIGYYQVEIEKFGLVPYSEEHFLQYGANSWFLDLTGAPSGTVSGTVTEAGTGVALNATVNIYREENEEWILHTSVNTVATSGGIYSVDLPYYTYLFKTTSAHHVPKTLTVLVNSASQTVDFALDPTAGNILVIDDDSGKRNINKVVDADGNLISEETEVVFSEKGQSANEISQALISLGYYVTIENAGSSNPDTWLDYDLVISSSGANSDPVNDDTYRTNLKQYVAEGGKLLIEGGEIGYDMCSYSGDTEFATNVLHVSDWKADNAGAFNQELPDHAISSIPNSIPVCLYIDYNSYGDEDACTPTSDAYIVYSNNENSAHAGIIVYDDNEVDISAQTVFYTFAYPKLSTAENREDLLENTVLYLLTPEIQGSGVLTGTVDLIDSDNDGGAIVEILGTNFETTTDVSGDYVINDIYPGTFSVKASKFGYTVQYITEVVIANDSTTENVDFFLQQLLVVFFDDFENGTSQWNLEESWGLTESSYFSATHSLTDSPEGNYIGNSAGWSASMAVPINMEECTQGLLRFWHKYELGAGDMANVEVSGDGSFWEIVKTFSGIQEDWEQVNLNLYSYTGYDFLWVRFRMSANAMDNLDGWYIDNVEVMLDAGSALVKGDINQDGNIDVADIVKEVNFILNTGEPPTPVEFWCADMNGDHQINVLDIVELVNIILNEKSMAKRAGKSATKCEIIRRGDVLYYNSDGDVAGLELHLIGGNKNSITVFPELVIESAVSQKNDQTVVLLYSMDEKVLPAGENALMTISEGMKVKSVIVSDILGKKVETYVRELPTQFSLYQNYPNPFNPTTKIAFDIPKSTYVTLTIYDILGRTIKVLIDQEFKSGSYEAIWDGRNRYGVQVASGIYFYSIESTDFNKIKKMILVR
ncbi:MAG: carboxypeptidase regulatory-like domain-containing protein [Candidatus Marinimicrobia bacterium]|nr:carboxypeptidase regulatory-like domain-containing protein [Candidatus Neomarinimicrobiota bacterium]